MTSKINLLCEGEENNDIMRMIIDKLEQEIKILISEMSSYEYELVKLDYNNVKHYTKLQENYEYTLSDLAEYEHDKREECKKNIRFFINYM